MGLGRVVIDDRGPNTGRMRIAHAINRDRTTRRQSVHEVMRQDIQTHEPRCPRRDEVIHQVARQELPSGAMHQGLIPPNSRTVTAGCRWRGAIPGFTTQPAGHRLPRNFLASAPGIPIIRLGDAAGRGDSGDLSFIGGRRQSHYRRPRGQAERGRVGCQNYERVEEEFASKKVRAASANSRG